jgi:pyruvate formate lyase activating enzyme
MIFNIQRFSLHDGEGLRTTVFLKGCPLRCTWCSNPESQSFHRELMFDASRCMGCGDCTSVDPEGAMTGENFQTEFHPERQINPEQYKDLCPTMALQLIGEDKPAEEIAREVLKDKAFYGENGGVTLSGGEPLMQPVLCRKIAGRVKAEGVSPAMETCLHVPWKNIETVIPVIDEFLCDVKHIDPDVFREQTGGDLNLIWENLAKLSRTGASIRIRIPVIDGFNHDDTTIPAILEKLKDLPRGEQSLKGVDFMPYHPLGAGKYRNLGRPYEHPLKAMPAEEIEPYIRAAEEMSMAATSGG